MQPSMRERNPLDLRARLESTGTSFVTACYPERAMLFLQGDAADTVLFVEKGRVQLMVTSASGRERICGILGPHAFLGEDLLSGCVVRQQTAIAMTETEVIVVNQSSMMHLLDTEPAIADFFIAHLLARNSRLTADLSAQLLESSEERLKRKLIELAGCDEHVPRQCLLPEVSQEVIAEMVGTTRSRVNRFIGRLKQRGLLEARGRRLYVTPLLWRHLKTNGIEVSQIEHRRTNGSGTVALSAQA